MPKDSLLSPSDKSLLVLLY
uniref:Uncharacterized protein n=1 Tax=Anguilla anguilla TaxID=7936 RepID=A0A0E9QVA8_ANGAN